MARRKTRTEKDALGKLNVPADAPRGIYTQRVLDVYPRDQIDPVPELFLRTYIEVKMIYATVNTRFRKITKEQKQAIHQAAKQLLKLPSDEFMGFFPIGQIQSGWGTSTNMMVNEVLANEATKLLGGKYGKYKIDPHNHLNASQSSNDTFPGTTKLTCLKLLPTLIDTVQALSSTCSRQARKRKKIKKVGRTHLQDAVVITVGDEFAAYARTLQKNKQHLTYIYKQLQELNFWGTATGSLQNISPGIRKELIRELNTFYKSTYTQAKNYFEQNSSSGDIALLSQGLVHLSNDLIKIGNDMRLLSSWPLAGFHEYDLPSVQPGSSIMPGKVNPSVVEALTMSCARVIGNDQTIQLLTRQAQLELQQFMPGIARSIIESLQRLTPSIEMFDQQCVSGITLHRQHISDLLNGSFAYATDYTETMGYEVVAEAVVKALKTGKTLKEILTMKK